VSDFTGAAVLVTGGSRGIGRAIALRFAQHGAATVAIGYLRNDKAAEATAEEIRALGAEPVLVRGNVSSERVLREVAELPPLTALVHNAATGVIRPALEAQEKHWDWTMTANARALLSLTQAAAPKMLEMARSRTPAGRMVTADDLAGVVKFLCTPEADMIRGQTIVVDGGYSLLA
jgi:enoyl-[acyl-carrier protein] reductase III